MTLEWKVFLVICLLFDLFHYRFLRRLVHRVSVHVDCFVRLGGACVFAPPAADAVFRLHFRDLEPFVRRIGIGRHVHGFRRTVLGARAAIRVVRIDHAVFFDELGDSYLRELLCLHRERLKGAARAKVHADRALKVAVARLEVHTRLHNAEETVFEKRWR